MSVNKKFPLRVLTVNAVIWRCHRKPSQFVVIQVPTHLWSWHCWHSWAVGSPGRSSQYFFFEFGVNQCNLPMLIDQKNLNRPKIVLNDQICEQMIYNNLKLCFHLRAKHKICDFVIFPRHIWKSKQKTISCFCLASLYQLCSVVSLHLKD